MPHVDHYLSDFEHSRTPGRIAAAVIAGGGVTLCMIVLFGVLRADEGTYSRSEARDTIAISVTLILLVCGLVAAVPLTARRRVRIDFEEGTVGAESELFGIVRQRVLPLSSDGHIVHREEQLTIGLSERTIWIVEYSCRDGAVELHRRANARDGRKWAERFSEHLDLPLLEAVDGHLTVQNRGGVQGSNGR